MDDERQEYVTSYHSQTVGVGKVAFMQTGECERKGGWLDWSGQALRRPKETRKGANIFRVFVIIFFLRRVSKDVWNGSRYNVIRRAAFEFLVLSVQIHAIAIYDLQRLSDSKKWSAFVFSPRVLT